MSIGERIQEARKKKKLTQKELAQKLGLATGTIQQYELNKRQPRLDLLREIAAALDISIFELMGATDEGNGLVSFTIPDWLMRRSGLDVNGNEEEYYSGYIEPNSDFAHSLAEYLWGTPLQKQLDEAFNKLNLEGKEKAIERIEELAEIPRYTRGVEDADNPKKDE